MIDRRTATNCYRRFARESERTAATNRWGAEPFLRVVENSDKGAVILEIGIVRLEFGVESWSYFSSANFRLQIPNSQLEARFPIFVPSSVFTLTLLQKKNPTLIPINLEKKKGFCNAKKGVKSSSTINRDKRL